MKQQFVLTSCCFKKTSEFGLRESSLLVLGDHRKNGIPLPRLLVVLLGMPIQRPEGVGQTQAVVIAMIPTYKKPSKNN
jgi:hypothetical protein